jgi:L-alanine-DL-glutamate epimerase-like enolase superfamily enzyme
LKITRIELQRLRTDLDPPFAAAWDPVPRRTFAATLVRVETDEGVVGVGSGDTMDGFEPFAHLFLGQDPLAIARHVRTLETISFHAGRYWPLEAALWDIAGQVCGQPVARLFGGFTDRLPAYASCGEARGPEARAEAALALRDEGFRALKIRIGADRLSEGVEVVQAVRRAIGNSMEIMVDLNQGWRMAGDITPSLDVPAVRRVVEALRELQVFWVEEPLAGNDVRGLAELRSGTGVRTAGGEMARTTDDLLAYLEGDALDVYQPDVVLAAGMSRVRMLAELALARNRWFSPHTWTNGLGLLANLHVVAGVGGGPFVEFPYDPPGWTVQRRDFFLAEPVRIDRDGYIRVPSLPGLGAVLDDDRVRHTTLV